MNNWRLCRQLAACRQLATEEVNTESLRAFRKEGGKPRSLDSAVKPNQDYRGHAWLAHFQTSE